MQKSLVLRTTWVSATVNTPMVWPFLRVYIAAELRAILVLQRPTRRIWLAFLIAAWVVIGMCLGFVRNYSGFLIVRAFLGSAEGGLMPGMVLYLSSMYTR